MPSYRLFTVLDGLAQQQVTCIFKDSRGYLWVGTKGGVSRFDGEKFFNFSYRDGLPSETVRAIDEDRDGNVWIYTSTGVAKYDGCRIQAFSFPPEWTPSDYRILRDTADRVWINRNAAPPIVRFLARGDSLVWASFNYRGASITHVHNGKVYGHSDSLGYLVFEQDSLQQLAQPNKTKRSIYYDHQLQDSLVAYAVPNVGQAYYLIQNGQEEFFLRYQQQGQQRFIDSINFAVLKRDFYLPAGKKLYHLDATAQQLHALPLPDIVYLNYYIDPAGIIWLGTEEGLLQLFPKGIINYTQPEMRYVWSVIEDDEGDFWLPRYSQGLSRIRGDSIWEEQGYLTATENSKLFYFGAKKDQQGRLYFPTGKGILIKEGQQWQIMKSPQYNSVLIFEWDSLRHQWLGGTRSGVNLYKNGQFIRYIGSQEGLHPNNFIVSINIDQEGNYWLGSFNGLSRYDPDNGKMYNYSLKNPSGQQEGAICLYRDHTGLLWIGGRRELMIHDAKRDTILSVPLEQDLGYINDIIETNEGQLLVGTMRGLIWLDLDAYHHDGSIRYHHMNQYNGYFGIEATQNALYKDSRGDIWVPSSTITTRFTPSQLNFSSQAPRPNIETVNSQRIPFQYQHDDSVYSLSSQELTITYGSIGYNRPTKTTYSYFLEGHSTAWSPWSASNSANFRGLRSGQYRFLLKTRDPNAAAGSEEASSLSIRIQLPFTQEPYFPALLFSILASLLLLALRMSYLSYQRGRLTARLNDVLLIKKNKIESQRDEIEALKDDLSHRFSNWMLLLRTRLQQELEHDPQVAAQNAYKRSLDLVQTVSYIEFLLQKQAGKAIDIQAFLEELADFFRSLTDNQSTLICFTINTPYQLDARSTKYLALLINELITNSIKHAFKQQPQPHIHIQLHKQGEHFLLTYQDNGCGIPSEHQASTGSHLLKTMSLQLGGQSQYATSKGLLFELRFPAC